MFMMRVKRKKKEFFDEVMPFDDRKEKQSWLPDKSEKTKEKIKDKMPFFPSPSLPA